MSSNLMDKEEILNDNGWEDLKLADVCELITRGVTPSYTEEEGVVVINQKCIRDNKINLELSRLTNSEKKKISEQKYLKNYDVLVNSTGVGTLGRVAQIKNINKKLTVDSHVTIVRANNKIHPEFLGYNLFMQQPNIEHLAEGSTGQTELSRTRLGEAIKLLIPTLEEQKTVAHILSTLDEKIETNNQINKKLEEMAQVIFKQWFVDFEFPIEDGEPYKSSGGEMVESEMGMIPKEWKTGTIESVCKKVGSGGTPSRKKSEYYEGNIIWLKTKELEDKFVFNSEEKITQIALEQSSAKLFPDKTIMMAMYGATVGKLGIISKELSFNQAACGMVVDENKQCYEYLYLWLVKERDNIINLATGSAQQNLSVGVIKSYPILVTSKECIVKFKNIVKPIFEMLESTQKENYNLKEIRDILLPKLMSGEIRVPLNN